MRKTRSRKGDLDIGTFVCISCRLKRQGTGPVCVHCDREMSARQRKVEVLTNLSNTKTEIIKHQVHVEPTFHPSDEALLRHISGGHVTPLFIYMHTYMAQHGKCSRCRNKRPIMRVVPLKGGRGVRNLVCPSCYRRKADLSPIKRGVSAYPIELLMWRKADPLLRVALSSNPTFTTALTSANEHVTLNKDINISKE